MFRKMLQSQTFVKYIISYALILTIPVLIFMLFIQKTIIPQMRNDAVNATKENVTSTRRQMESKLQSFDRISTNISFNRKLTPYTIEKNYYKKYEAIEELNKYQMSSDITENIFYYMLGDDRIYTAYNEADIDIFFSKLYPFEGWDGEYFYKLANTEIKQQMKNIETKDAEYLIYIYPNAYSITFFLINADDLKGILNNTFKEYSQNMIILDQNFQLIISTREIDPVIAQNIDLVQKSVKNKNEENVIEIAGKHYLISSSVSNKNGWVYLSIVDDDIFMENIRNTSQKVIKIAVGIFLIGSLIIVMWSYFNYKPIYQIEEIINENTNKGKDFKKSVGFKSIPNAVNDIIASNQKLKQNLENHKPILREHLLREIIQGKNLDRMNFFFNDWQQMLAENCYYLCAIISSVSGDRLDKSKPFQSISDFIELQYEGKVQFFPVDTVNYDRLILIISIKEALIEYNHPIVVQLCTRIQKELKFITVAGVGKPYKEVLSIGQSYMEAEQACHSIDYVNVIESDFAFYDDDLNRIVEKEKGMSYPYEDINKLIQQLMEGDDTAKATILSIFKTISKPSVPRVLARCIILDIVNHFMKIMVDLEMNHENIRGNYMKMLSMKSFEDVNELNRVIAVTCIEMCDEILSFINHRDELKNNLTNYIALNFCDNMFSVENMARYFGMNVSQLCQVYKDYTGVTILNRVWELRLNKAKEMLIQSDMKIKDIIQSVGYYDSSAFIRKFKKAEGITPGQYRKENINI